MVLILGEQRLVVLEVPKTGSLALRAMLEPYATPLLLEAPRHVGMTTYLRHHARRLAEALGGPLETVAVVREPVARMQSWYRYRMRDQVTKTRISTRDLGFGQFMTDYLSDSPPDYAKIGRQDRFVGWDGKQAKVDHLFDYGQLERLTAFLSGRMGKDLKLGRVNVSSGGGEAVDVTLDAALMSRFLERHAVEFDLYRAVQTSGHLVRWA